MLSGIFRKGRGKQSFDKGSSTSNKSYAPFFGDPTSERAAWEKEKSKQRKHQGHDGEQVLLTFIRARLGPGAEGLAMRLMNKTPIKPAVEFTYKINQSTEETDLQIINRDLRSGRLFRTGTKLHAGSWCNLLLGESFIFTPSTKQVHELIYVRSSCTCLACLIKTRNSLEVEDDPSEDDSFYSHSTSYTPAHSAMANFIQMLRVPSLRDFQVLDGYVEQRELQIGVIVRLNKRASSKFKFTEDIKPLFCHLAYTGPVTHEEVYRKVTTIGVNYYMYNKGKKERKVFLRGHLVSIPINMGVIKLGARPLRTDELGCHYIVHRKQTIQLYQGEIALEGNSIGS